MTNLWINDMSILFDKSTIFEIIPDTSFDFNRKLNAIFRFSLYYSILSFVLFKQNTVFIFPMGVMILTILFQGKSMGLSDSTKQSTPVTVEGSSKPVQQSTLSCQIPKLNNPFMNLNIFDIPKNPPKACDSYDNPQVQDKIESLFDTGLVKSTADIYSTNNSQNRFYTMPNTQSANEQTRLAEWCYKLPPTCKEGNGIQCSANVYRAIGSRHPSTGAKTVA